MSTKRFCDLCGHQMTPENELTWLRVGDRPMRGIGAEVCPDVWLKAVLETNPCVDQPDVCKACFDRRVRALRLPQEPAVAGIEGLGVVMPDASGVPHAYRIAGYKLPVVYDPVGPGAAGDAGIPLSFCQITLALERLT